jgi:hypothetical protein
MANRITLQIALKNKAIAKNETASSTRLTGL